MSVSHTSFYNLVKLAYSLSFSLSLSLLGQNHKAHPLPALSLGRVCTCSKTLDHPLGWAFRVFFKPWAKTPEASISIMYVHNNPMWTHWKIVIFHDKLPRGAFGTFPKALSTNHNSLKKHSFFWPMYVCHHHPIAWQSLGRAKRERPKEEGWGECQIFSWKYVPNLHRGKCQRKRHQRWWWWLHHIHSIDVLFVCLRRGGCYLFLPGFSFLYDAIHGWMTGQMDGWKDSRKMTMTSFTICNDNILKDFGFSFRGFFEDYIFAWWNIWVSIIPSFAFLRYF